MPVNTTDSGQVRITGENNWMMLFHAGTEELTTNVSVWNAHFSPVGPGHALFWHSELTGGGPKIYADNPSLARWLQDEILGGGPTAVYCDRAIPVVEAVFSRSGTLPWFVTERVEALGEVMEFTWFDCLDAYAGHSAADRTAGETHDHYALYVPAMSVRVTLNGRQATGVALARERDGWPSSSCFLAMAESWLRTAIDR